MGEQVGSLAHLLKRWSAELGLGADSRLKADDKKYWYQDAEGIEEQVLCLV